MHPEAITSERKKIFEKLKKFPEFYLVGGTALALQIGHRISIDFDMFWEKDLSKNVLNKIKRVFRGSKIEVIREHSEQLSVIVDGVKIDFVKNSFPLLFKPIKYQGVSLAKIPEIAVMKARTIGRRPILKDYIDLFYILKEKHTNLARIIELGQKKYSDEFNARLFLEQLIYLEDVQEIKIEFLKKKITKEEMKIFFEKQIAKLKL